MALYKESETIIQKAEPALSRDDIVSYHERLDSYQAQARQDQDELNYLIGELRNEQFNYKQVIRAQDDRIRELTMLVLTLTNKVDKLTSGD